MRSPRFEVSRFVLVVGTFAALAQPTVALAQTGAWIPHAADPHTVCVAADSRDPECRLAVLEARLVQTPLPEERDEGPAVVGLALGVGALALGLIGLSLSLSYGLSCIGERCDAWPSPGILAAMSGSLAGLGAIGTLIGGVSLRSLNAPFRERRRLERQIERLRDRLHVGVSVGPTGGSLTVGLAF